MDKPLVGSEIHGFRTLQDLDADTIMEEAKGRWLCPKEIHAILSNYKYFTIHVNSVNLPPSGTIVLFDRKMHRHFRKDGYNWKKRKDRKTVVESHEHVKVGDEERIDVYYAHGEDKPTFVRRCYRLLDKSLEHIVLVHYRDTLEAMASGSRKVLALLPGNGRAPTSFDYHLLIGASVGGHRTALRAIKKAECSVAPPGSVAASKLKHRKADKVNQGNARLKNLRVCKLIQKARRMRQRKLEEDHETNLFNGHVDMGPSDLLSTSADELTDFRGLAKLEKAFVPLLDEVCSCHSSLIRCQMKRSPKFKEWAFTALGRVLHFLRTKKVKDMTDDACAELECLWEELQAFKFDLAWLEPYVERALCVNKLVKREIQSLKEVVNDLEAKLDVARKELEKVEGVEKMDMDKVLGYGV